MEMDERGWQNISHFFQFHMSGNRFFTEYISGRNENLEIEQMIEQMQKTDAELLASYTGSSDENALNELIRRYAPMVFRTGYRVLHDVHEAEDVAQAWISSRNNNVFPGTTGTL